MNAPTYSLVTRLGRSMSLWVGGFWLLTAAAVAVYVYHEIQESFDASLVESAHRLLDLAVHEVDETDAPSPSSLSISKEVEDSQGAKVESAYLAYQVMSAPGKVVLRSAGAPTVPFVDHLVAGFAQDAQWRTYTLRHSARELFIVVADPSAHRLAALSETILWLILPLLALLPLLMWAVRKVTAAELLSLQKIVNAITSRGGANLSPIGVTGLSKELSAIGDSTNHLLARLDDALKLERALAANAAHELRTPLAAAMLSLSTAQAYPMSDQAREAVAQMAQSLNALGKRTEKILQLSRAEAGAALAQEPFDLAALTIEVVQEFDQISSPGSRIKLSLPQDGPVLAHGDFDSLAIAIRNLIENSLKYAPGSEVFVTVSKPPCVSVRDAGPGVLPDDLPRIQQRHLRLVSTNAGFGLGMSIVQTIIAKQGGTLSLHSPPTGYANGFEAVLIFGNRVAS
jgi:two-component system, OmpR family, sensor kinase